VRAQTIREFNLELSYWQGFENQQKRYGATSVQWIRDYLTLNSSAERLTYTLQQGFVQTTIGKLELTLEYPIRWPNP
jgi:hypothetical protein